MFRRSLQLLALLSSIALVSYASPTVAAETASPSAILANPSAFDRKHVSAPGVVERLEEKTSKAGNGYDTFQLCDPRACVHVFAWGHPQIQDGQHVTVRGTFSAVKHVGAYTFRNEIEADQGAL